MLDDITIWAARDEEYGLIVTCELYRLPDGKWQWSMVDGAFAGYPSITLNRTDIETLYQVLGNELQRTSIIKDEKE